MINNNRKRFGGCLSFKKMLHQNQTLKPTMLFIITICEFKSGLKSM